MKFLNSAVADKKYSILPAIIMTPQTQNLLASSVSSSQDSNENEENSFLKELSPRSVEEGNRSAIGKRTLQ